MRPQSLVGEWDNPEASLILQEEGSFVAIFGQAPLRGHWQLHNTQLTLTAEEETRRFTVRFTDSTLWLDNIPFQPLKEDKPERWVPAKLSGTWGCFKDGPVYGGSYHIQRTLYLKSSGTYYFHSESHNSGAHGQASGASEEAGHWWVEGSLMWFEDHRGQTSSRRLDLQNHPGNSDPMIVLDGENYVSRERRPPW